MKFVYTLDCTQADGNDIREMVDGEHTELTYIEFRRAVEGLDEWAKNKGYARAKNQGSGVTLKGDWHVSYHKGTFRGTPCYWLDWSCFNNIWLPEGWDDLRASS